MVMMSPGRALATADLRALSVVTVTLALEAPVASSEAASPPSSGPHPATGIDRSAATEMPMKVLFMSSLLLLDGPHRHGEALRRSHGRAPARGPAGGRPGGQSTHQMDDWP